MAFFAESLFKDEKILTEEEKYQEAYDFVKKIIYVYSTEQIELLLESINENYASTKYIDATSRGKRDFYIEELKRRRNI